MVILLMTPEGKKVVVSAADREIYGAPCDPPNFGTDLRVHKARSGRLYYYLYNWSLWNSVGSSYKLLSEEQAKNFVLLKLGGSQWERDGVHEDAARALWGEDFLAEDA